MSEETKSFMNGFVKLIRCPWNFQWPSMNAPVVIWREANLSFLDLISLATLPDTRSLALPVHGKILSRAANLEQNIPESRKLAIFLWSFCRHGERQIFWLLEMRGTVYSLTQAFLQKHSTKTQLFVEIVYIIEFEDVEENRSKFTLIQIQF